jgi:small subunit ribosomal protein S18
MIPDTDVQKRMVMRKRVCRYCADPQLVIDYKDPRILQPFVSDRAKIIPRRVTGNCAYHQRRITEAIKRARLLALLPFVTLEQA